MFTNPLDGNIIALKGYINFKTKNVIYGLICPCRKLYIGQSSQQLRKSIQKHLSTITLADRDYKLGKKLTPVEDHF